MDSIKEYNRILAEKTISELEKRNMQGFYCPTKEDALTKALELIKEKSSVTWGGSQTIKEIGLIDALSNSDYNILDRSKAKTPEEIKEIYRKAFFCDYYLTSSNAVTQDGKLVNVDGNGNRVAALIYGPNNVIVIVGINKIEKNESEALTRVRGRAAAINALRLNKNTPCSKTGACFDCLGDDCICCQTVITRKSKEKNRIKVIIVGENLGY